MKWKLEPAKISAVLKGIGPSVTEMSTWLSEERLSAIVQDTDLGDGLTAKIPATMAALISDQVADIKAITQHVNAGVTGVYNATLAYHNGNTEMAATFQKEMVKAASTGDMSYFDKHGYKVSGK